VLNSIIDAILPGDQELNLPPASKTNFDSYVNACKKQDLIGEFSNLTNQVCLEKFSKTFLELSDLDRLKALEFCKSKNIRLFMDFVANLYRAYYTNAKVLEAINVGSIPPFPAGNAIGGDDWEILEPVFERGRIYRAINPDGLI